MVMVFYVVNRVLNLMFYFLKGFLSCIHMRDWPVTLLFVIS